MKSFIIVTLFVIVICHAEGIKHTYESYTPFFNENEQWFIQKLDHFGSDNQTWKQRYFASNLVFDHTKDTPVFLMIEGECQVDIHSLRHSPWMEYAKEFQAFCFLVEHRYYGLSRPTSNLSTENLQYLSSEQAIADLANFITKMKSKYGLTSNKWIALGCSYSGSLAAWLRFKHPGLIHASISSSAPLLATADFKEFNGAIVNSLKNYHEDCANEIYMANVHLTALFTFMSGGKILTEKFRLCTPLQITNKYDNWNLAETLAHNINSIIYYNDPRSEVTVEDICSIMVDESIGVPLSRYALLNEIFLEIKNENCRKFKYEDEIKNFADIEWNGDTSKGGRQWFYQVCTEFGFFQTSSSPVDLYGPNFPLQFFVQQCSDIFGERFNEERLKSGVSRTNRIFGEALQKVTRVVFVYGSMDPWNLLGATSANDIRSPIILINGTGHCADSVPSMMADTPQLKEARKQIVHYIREWLRVND